MMGDFAARGIVAHRGVMFLGQRPEEGTTRSSAPKAICGLPRRGPRNIRLCL
jgi:hypothetical protein